MVHILAEHNKKKTSDLIAYIIDFLQDVHHVTWIRSVGSSFLQRKGIPIGDYLMNLQDISIPLDQLGILVYARMYHKHYAIVLKDSVWTTRKDNSLKDCSVIFAYCGGVYFSDTCTGPATGPLPSPPALLKTVEQNIRPINLSNSKRPRSITTKTVKPKAPKKHHNRSKTGLRSDTAKSALVRYASKTVKRATKNSKCTSNFCLELDDILHGKKKRQTAPKKLTEPDPLKEHLSDLSPLPSNNHETSDEEQEPDTTTKNCY